MIEIAATSARILRDAGFFTRYAEVGPRRGLIFEDETVLGFLVTYDTVNDLIQHWEQDAKQLVGENQFGLRRALQKAWNVYVVLFSSEPSSEGNAALLAAVEEDLRGTRKIVRAGLQDIAEVTAGLLPLIPLQHAPKLDAVDMIAEIRQRSTELQPKAVEAFLSSAEEAIVLQALEELP